MRQGLIFFIRSRKRLRRRSRRSRRKISPLRTKPKGEMFSSVGCNRTPIFRSKRSFARLDAFRGKVGFGGPSRISVFCASRRHNCVLPAMSDLAGGASGGQTSQIRAQNVPGRHLSRRTPLLKSAKYRVLLGSVSRGRPTQCIYTLYIYTPSQIAPKWPVNRPYFVANGP